MRKEKLGFSVHFHGTLEKAIGCPLGNYYVDIKNRMFYFEPTEGHNRRAARMTATVLAALGIEAARAIEVLYEDFAEVSEKDITKDGENYKYDFHVQGDLELFVETKYGCLYGSHEHETYFFKSAHPGFLAPIEFSKFIEGIERDIHGDNEDDKTGAELVKEILKTWVELDKEDIVE